METLQMQWSLLNETVFFPNKLGTFPNGQFTLHHPVERDINKFILLRFYFA